MHTFFVKKLLLAALLAGAAVQAQAMEPDCGDQEPKEGKAAITACQFQKLISSDQEMTRVYNELRGQLRQQKDSEGEKTLVASQQAWMERFGKACGEKFDSAGAACRTTWSIQRAEELRPRLKTVSPD